MLLTLLAATALSQAADSRVASSSSSSSAPVCSSSGACTGQASAAFSVGHGADSSSSPPWTMEVASWSWGVSNSGAASSSSMGAGRVVSPRDAASGLPTGKRQHGPVRWMAPESTAAKRAAMCGSSQACAAASSITLTMKDKGGRCVAGTHYPSVVLSSRDSSVHLSDVVVSACDASSGSVSLNFSKIDWK